METRARYLLVGVFSIAIIVAGFVFVFWLHNAGGLRDRAAYQIRFDSPVMGLRTGSAVLFNGIRVGEVTDLQLDASNPRSVIAAIAIARETPMRADTQVGLESQGLMGAPAVTLKGGTQDAPKVSGTPGRPAVLVADATATQDTMQSAREVLRRIDGLLVENAEPIRSTIANLNTFTGVLARNVDRIDRIAEGAERMLGQKPAAARAIFDLTAPREFPNLQTVPNVQIAVLEPTAVLALDTQRMLVRTDTGESTSLADVQWSDSIPKLVQARIMQGFENAGFQRITRPGDFSAADYQLALDIRTFAIVGSAPPSAAIEIGVKTLDKSGAVVASEIFHSEMEAKGLDPLSAGRAMDQAFRVIVQDAAAWTSRTLAAQEQKK